MSDHSIYINMAAGGQTKIERMVSIFRELTGRNFDVHQYRNRLMLQKLVYLLQIRDKTLGYHFTWFVRGPYCSQLAHEAYEYRGSETASLSANDMENVKFAREILAEVDERNAEHNAELVASLYYLMTARQTTNFDDIYFMLHSLKPWFEENETKRAYERILPFIKKAG